MIHAYQEALFCAGGNPDIGTLTLFIGKPSSLLPINQMLQDRLDNNIGLKVIISP